MNRAQVEASMRVVRKARAKWDRARAQHKTQVNKAMKRLVLEAFANRMSIADVCAASGYTPRMVRLVMKTVDLDPKKGKGLLADFAAKNLAANAAALGVAPREMDLMSPLAYLPMGKDLRAELADAAVSGNLPTWEEWIDNVSHADQYGEHVVTTAALRYRLTEMKEHNHA